MMCEIMHNQRSGLSAYTQSFDMPIRNFLHSTLRYRVDVPIRNKYIDAYTQKLESDVQLSLQYFKVKIFNISMSI